MVTSPWFDRIVLFLILANSLFIAATGPLEQDAPYVRVVEWCFAVIFTLEVALKMVDSPRDFLKDRWNLLDTLVVLFSWPALLTDGLAQYAALRIFRVVRPLRTVSRLPGLRDVVESLLRALPGIGDVAFLLAFVFTIFAITGVQLFKGTLHRRCVPEAVARGAPLDGRILGGTPLDEAICAPPHDVEAGWGQGCEPGFVCAEFVDGNPDWGWTSFDRADTSLLAVLVAVSLEGWTGVMYMLSKGSSPFLARSFMVTLVTVGSFLVMCALA